MVFMEFSGDQGLRNSQTSAPVLAKPPPSECPRCGSINTKFCYYNNYNKLQPRHFCKSCKRHWTKGGALRNIPAGRRRSTNKRRPRTRTPTAASATENMDLSLSSDQKNISNILYESLIQSSSPSASASAIFHFESTILESSGTTHTAASDSAPQTHNHPNSSFTSYPTFDYYQFSSNYNMDKFAENLDSAEESTVTTSAAAAAAADSWSWSDVLGSSADLNTVWDYLTLL